MEKQLGGSGNDSASRLFSREASDLELHDRMLVEQKTHVGRDKVSMATASLVLGSPFMMFGLGVALFEEFGAIKAGKQLQALQAQRQRLFAPIKGAEIVEQKSIMGFGRQAHRMPLSTLFNLDEIERRATRGSKVRPDAGVQLVFTDAHRNRAAFLSSGRRWVEASKLVKQKQSLKDQLEKLNNGRNFGLITKLASKIELLDKALKKLGC